MQKRTYFDTVRFLKRVEENKLEAYFYRSYHGNEPVRDWLRTLPKPDKKAIGEAIKMVQYGWPLGMPLVRKLKCDLWECRVSLQRHRIARVIFCLDDDRMILLHGFVKKTQKIPWDVLRVAEQRRQNFLREKGR